jgi:hemerythrin-like domain-containing protein
MLRDPSLIPLSRQHQHALALCVRIQRALGSNAASADPIPWEAEIDALFNNEIRFHFAAEEQVLFPAAAEYPLLKPLVEELLAEHGTLRRLAAAASERKLGAQGVLDFAAALAVHIRKEERQLFQECQRLMGADKLAELGAALDRNLAASGMPGAACAIPRLA